MQALRKQVEKTVEGEMLAMRKQVKAMGHQLYSLTVELQRKSTSQFEDSSSNQREPKHEHALSHIGDIQPRTVRLEFPTFHGEEPLGWLYKVNQFFTFHNTPIQHRMRLVSFHMKG